MTAPEGGAEADRKGARMSIRPPSPPRRAVAALALAFLVLAAACTPGGSDDNKSSSSGPVTLKLQANAVKGGMNATEASWIQDYRRDDGELVGAGQPAPDAAAQGLRATPP